MHRSGPYMSAVLLLHLVLKRKVSCTCAVRRHAVVCSEKIKQLCKSLSNPCRPVSGSEPYLLAAANIISCIPYPSSCPAATFYT